MDKYEELWVENLNLQHEIREMQIAIEGYKKLIDSYKISIENLQKENSESDESTSE